MIFPEIDLSDYFCNYRDPVKLLYKFRLMRTVMKRHMLTQWYFQIQIQNQKPIIHYQTKYLQQVML